MLKNPLYPPYISINTYRRWVCAYTCIVLKNTVDTVDISTDNNEKILKSYGNERSKKR